MPSSVAARNTRIAISDRLATSSLRIGLIMRRGSHLAGFAQSVHISTVSDETITYCSAQTVALRLLMGQWGEIRMGCQPVR
jgi:hypothetical protein